jgi:hypothetical protein
MTYTESIVKLVEAMNGSRYEKDREYIKDTINLLKTYIDREDDYKKLEERIQSLESSVSFINLDKNRGG